MKFINREEVCSACLEYQLQPLEISDECIKDVYKCFTNDYKNDKGLYLCYYCKHTFSKISSFKSMCTQSYLFLTKNLHCSKFNSSLVEEEKTIMQNNTNCLSLSNIIYVSLSNDEYDQTNNDIITINHDEKEPEEINDINFGIKEENFDEDSDDPLAAYIADDDDVKLPIDFENEIIKSSLYSSKSEKEKYPIEIKEEIQESVNIFENITQMTLTQEDQIKELEEKKQSEKYLQALYKCEKCAQSFGLEICLKRHMMKHDESRGSYECWLCYMRFPSKDLLRAHSLLHSTRLLCKLCNYESHNHNSMKDHLEWHAGITYPCNLCDKVFKKRHALSNHLTKHKHDKKKRNFKCQQCDKAYFTKDVLRQHEYFHTDTRLYTCDTCGKAFKTKGRLNYHMKIHSVKTGEHYCVECDISFKSEYSLKNHLDNSFKHKDPSLLRFECKQCPKKYESEEQLDSHIQTSHDRIPRIPCDICGVFYVTRHGLNYHKRKVHQGFVLPLKYGCSTCDKQFTTSAQLKNHIRTHTGERPFECTLCDWKFTQKSSLRTHIKLKHLKIKRNTPIKKSKEQLQPDDMFRENDRNLHSMPDPHLGHLISVSTHGNTFYKGNHSSADS